MRKTKRMAALALTIAMTTDGVTNAYAAGAAGEASVEASKDIESTGDTSMLLTGTIKVTALNVTIPAIVSFNVGMTKVLASDASDKTVNVQIKQPVDTVYKIVNNSASSVWVYVIGVAPETNDGNLPILTGTYADVKTKNDNMLFAIKDSTKTSPAARTYSDPVTEPSEIGTTTYWMTSAISSINKCYLNSTTKGELIAKDLAVDARASKNEVPLTVYASTRKGRKVGDKFNVTPVLTISVAGPIV